MDFSSFTADGVQEDNVAGLRRFWKVITKVFTGEYPAKAHVVAGEVTADVLAFLPQYYEPAEYILPNDTKGFDYELGGADGSEGWKHMLVYEKAGHNNALVAEMQKDMNARAVYFVEDTAGQIIVVGSSVKGLKLTSKGGSGKQGGEKRGAVMAAEEVGYKWAPVPMSAAMKAQWMLRMAGYGPYYQGNVYFNNTLTVGVVKSFTLRDDMGVAIAMTEEYSGGAWAQRAMVAWKVGDTVLITKGVFNAPPVAKTSMSLKDGWAKATVTSIATDGFVSLTPSELGVGGLSSNFFVFHKTRTKYTGLTAAEAIADGYYGEWVLGYTAGTLPYVAGDNVFVQQSNGSGGTRKVAGRFVSQVGNNVTINVATCVVAMTMPAPAATVGYEIMEDVVFV
ncbi:MAG: hypothetical protein Q8K92_08285 [Leadbetterella sp.]|nr:hypothetical protein [Leadbetterella sp.]